MVARPMSTFACLAIAAATLAGNSDPHYIVRDRSAARSPLPFSEAVLSGSTL